MVNGQNTKIIAFGHQKGVGKSTAAKFLDTYIRTTYPAMKVKHSSFAGKLKDVSFQLFGWAGLERGIYYENKYPEKEVILPLIGKSPRQLWIEVGNKMREIDENVWLKNALNCPKCDLILISDLRFTNEADYIRANNGLVVKINRPGVAVGTDQAEVDLLDYDNWDAVIDNDGTLDDLNTAVTKYFGEFTDV